MTYHDSEIAFANAPDYRGLTDAQKLTIPLFHEGCHGRIVKLEPGALVCESACCRGCGAAGCVIPTFGVDGQLLLTTEGYPFVVFLEEG